MRGLVAGGTGAPGRLLVPRLVEGGRRKRDTGAPTTPPARRTGGWTRRRWIAVAVAGAIAACLAGGSRAADPDPAKLPVLEIAVGWPVAKLARRSPDVQGLPTESMNHVGTFSWAPVRLRYAGNETRFEVARTHSFTVDQDDGRVTLLEVDIAPYAERNPGPAFVQLDEWSKRLDAVTKARFHDADGCAAKHTIQAARRHVVQYVVPLWRAAVGCWQDDDAIYALELTEHEVHERLFHGPRIVVPVYHVTITVTDRSLYLRSRSRTSMPRPATGEAPGRS